MFYLCSEIKGADQLRSNCAAVICTFVFAYAKGRFSCDLPHNLAAE